MTEQELDEISLPRLQIKCTKIGENYKERIWNYDLVYKHFTGEVLHISFGKTTVEGGKGNIPIEEDGTFDLPYRDGVHIKNDSLQLRLPAFAICENIVQKIDLKKFIESFPEKALNVLP